MKQLIIVASLALASITIFQACQKTTSTSNTETSLKYDIDKNELKGILEDLNSDEKVGPGWWEKFTKWVNSHSGSSQKYVNGQPVCSGDGGCGPCPGICFSSGFAEGGEDGSISDGDLLLGLKPLRFAVIEKTSNGVTERRLLIEMSAEYVNAFIMNSTLNVPNDYRLPDFYVRNSGFSEIVMKAGTYASEYDLSTGKTFVVINITTR